MSRLNFCTLFNHHYLDKALAMIASLQKHCPDFQLFCFAFDDLTVEILNQLALPNVTVIGLNNFESPDLLAIKPSRNAKEYCWTCTPFTLKYCLEHFEIPHCTYLDADLYFFADPTHIFPETPWNTLITPHRYTPKYEASETSGIFCVQWVSFNRNPDSQRILNDWCQNCLDWCYEIPENGKFGDQKYLDTWPQDYPNVIILEDPGIGMAPWNMQQYETFICSKGNLKIRTRTAQKFRLFFFHFHHVIHYQNNVCHLGNYPIPKSAQTHIYRPYLVALETAQAQLKMIRLTIPRKKTSWDKQLLATLNHWTGYPKNWIIQKTR